MMSVPPSRIDFEASLNTEQLAAALGPDGPALVLAAAGTGKTRTLVYRVAYLAERGIPPDRILLLTFTNRAAREMLERAENLAGPGISGVWGGTFHHMANRILRRHAPALNYRSDYTILDRDDSRTLVRDCLRDLKLDRKDFPKRDVLLALFSSAANTEGSVVRLAEDRFADTDVDLADVARVHEKYEEKKRALDAMDFDDMLVNCLKLLRERPDVCAGYQERFAHVLVDEYQDTNTIQAELVDRLAEQRRNLLVVGDDFQSIYAWRGADFRNIMSFPERYREARTYKLETNYRSVPEILAVANTCIAGNPEQFQKELRPTREAYHKPRLVRVRDGEAQARHVVDEIRELRRSGYKYREMAVLYRAHFHAMELQMTLTREGIPYAITSGVRFFEQAHIKDVCSLLRVLVSPEDQLAFTRLLMLLPGVGPRTAIRIWDRLGGAFGAANDDHVKLVADSVRPGAREAWAAISRIMMEYREEGLSEDGGEVMHRFAKAFYEGYAAKTFENAARRLDDIGELVLYTAKFESVRVFLSDVALLTNLDAEDASVPSGDNDGIRLSTVHQAKGLEWPVVMLVWLTEGMFPSARSVAESADGEAEERRLFYVAVTRAKDELVLCVPEIRRLREGGVMPCLTSRFVDELPRELLEEAHPMFF